MHNLISKTFLNKNPPIMRVTKLLIFPVEIRIFLPQNDQIWPKIGIFGQFGPGHAGLFNALLWVGWWLWRAGCISQDTYLLYVSHSQKNWMKLYEMHLLTSCILRLLPLHLISG